MSAHHTRKPLNSGRVRARKRTLAARDGAWCTYCGRLFADLKQASIDHVAPLSLFPTWAAEHTVLACRSCNDRKADRLPLLFALLLTTWSESADRTHSGSGAHTASGRVLTAADWLLLARLAAAHESAGWLPESADPTPDRTRERSRSDQPGHRAHLTLVGTHARSTAPDPTTRPDAFREAA